MKFELIRPSVDYCDSYINAIRAFQDEGLTWWLTEDADFIAANFEEYVAKELAKVNLRTEVFVPSTEFWGIVDGKFAGRISIRHELNEALRKLGGHIGYDVAPAYRGKGVATLMLKHTLPHAKKLGLKEVLLTCDDTNAASVQVIEKNGGILKETKAIAPGKPAKRYYWIKL